MWVHGFLKTLYLHFWTQEFSTQCRESLNAPLLNKYVLTIVLMYTCYHSSSKLSQELNMHIFFTGPLNQGSEARGGIIAFNHLQSLVVLKYMNMQFTPLGMVFLVQVLDLPRAPSAFRASASSAVQILFA